MTDKRLGILQHALGLDQYGRRNGPEYRNWFVTTASTRDFAPCMEMVEAGLMIVREPTALSGGGHVFQVTEAGRKVVLDESPAPPKLTRSQKRYEAFLTEDSGMSFGDWLRSRGAK